MPRKNSCAIFRSSLSALGLLSLAAAGLRASSPAIGELMPVPASVNYGLGELEVGKSFTIGTSRPASTRLQAAIDRLRNAWAIRGADVPKMGGATETTLQINCASEGSVIPALGEDESYRLGVDATHAFLTAATETGALRGLSTLTQLLAKDNYRFVLPACQIEDSPRFPWRGLMIDVSRRWQPIGVIERNLDAMELVKLNVLHLHLTDDQGFRVESKTHPELPGLGSDGNFFTQAQIREIIAYAAARGIRVVPEFDVPGHATSWVVSHPELASLPGPYQIERHWGVFDPVLDPTNERTYQLLADFLGEMAELFPDPFLHIGGDENNGVQWNANPKIQAYIHDHGLKDNAGLHAYFNSRVAAILAKHGKRMIGWDEILNPSLPKDSVIDSWRGPEALGATAKLGFSGILSNGFYIDLVFHAGDHYLNEPFPAETKISPEEKQRVLGGEATMWAEWVSPETIDSRIWPRTAAVAERLWSPANVRDVTDMYRRLATVNLRLTEVGTRQDSNAPGMVAHLIGPNAPEADLAAVRTLISIVEPVKHYARGGIQIWANQQVPLIGLADAAKPDSLASRSFCLDLERFVFSDSYTPAAADALKATLASWSSAAKRVRDLGSKDEYPGLREAKDPAAAVIATAQVATAAIDALVHGQSPSQSDTTESFRALDRAGQKSLSATELPFLPSLRLLVAASAEQAFRSSLGQAAWKAKVESLALPVSKP